MTISPSLRKNERGKGIVNYLWSTHSRNDAWQCRAGSCENPTSFSWKISCRLGEDKLICPEVLAQLGPLVLLSFLVSLHTSRRAPNDRKPGPYIEKCFTAVTEIVTCIPNTQTRTSRYSNPFFDQCTCPHDPSRPACCTSNPNFRLKF